MGADPEPPQGQPPQEEEREQEVGNTGGNMQSQGIIAVFVQHTEFVNMLSCYYLSLFMFTFSSGAFIPHTTNFFHRPFLFGVLHLEPCPSLRLSTLTCTHTNTHTYTQTREKKAYAFLAVVYFWHKVYVFVCLFSLHFPLFSLKLGTEKLIYSCLISRALQVI